MGDIIDSMKDYIKKIPNKKDNTNSREKDIKRTANSVFEQYKKSFKDLARYDRGEKISTN